MAADPESPPSARVLLATMARSSINLFTHVGIVQSVLAGKVVAHIVAASGPYLDDGRNKAVAGGHTHVDADGNLTWDWFLFVDSDIEFNVGHIDTLFAPTLHPDYDPTRYPIIGGVYYNPFDDGGLPDETTEDGQVELVGPVVFEWLERDDHPGALEGIPTWSTRRMSRQALATLPPIDQPWNPEGTPSPVCQVHSIGAGFLAIHASLFATMSERYGEPLPWFAEPIVNGVHYGEDFGFCIRAHEMGYPVLAHRGCTPLHHKTIKLV